MATVIQVYSEVKSPRFEYALDLVFRNILNIDYAIVKNPDSELPLINYSADRSIGGIFIQPEGLLFETGIRPQDIWIAHIDGLPLFFQQPPEAGFIIDIFSFSFYLVSRYEEYLPFTRDEHGRFAAESSLAYKHNFLNLPVVDLWVQKFARTINYLYPSVKFQNGKYRSLLTIDVDIPFAYRGKGLTRNLGGLIRDSISGISIVERWRCITGRIKDPYDTYNYLNNIALKSKVPVRYFFTAGDRSKYDKNPKPSRPCYKKLIKYISDNHDIGLHPSYNSNKDSKVVRKEISRLERASGGIVDSVRKHFLLLSFPDTYQELCDLGIKHDYTLGYAREAGFRASIARPFKFYDLESEKVTNLVLYPFQYMDGTLQQYKRLTPDEAIATIRKLVQKTVEVNGLFISLWHNTSLTEKDGWEGWQRVFEEAIKIQSNGEDSGK